MINLFRIDTEKKEKVVGEMTNQVLSREEYYQEIFNAAKRDDREQFRDLFLTLHERDQQELFHLLYPEKKRKISNFLTPTEFSEIFEWMDIEDQEAAVRYLPDAFIKDVFDALVTDVIVDFFLASEETDTDHLLDIMDDQEAKKVEEILSYELETAGSIMTKEFFAVHVSDSSADVVNKIRSFGDDNAETIYYLYALNDQEQLVGVVSLRDLLTVSEDEIVGNIMNQHVLSANISEDQEEVAKKIQDYDLLALPVLSHDGRMMGIITVDDVLDILEQEAEEDFIEFAAISASNEPETEEVNALSIAKQRTPWIIVLLFLSMFTGGLISAFESTLSAVVSLAAYIPLIMGATGNVGTQSLAVAVRSMNKEGDSNTASFLEVLKNELSAGFITGSLSAIVMLLLVLALTRNFVLAFIVSLSILVSITLAAGVGTAIPQLLQRLNIDPAVASGPFITTINDTLGLLIYFTIATSLLSFL